MILLPPPPAPSLCLILGSRRWVRPEEVFFIDRCPKNVHAATKLVWNKGCLTGEKNRTPLAHRRINHKINFSDCVQHFFIFVSDLELGNQQGKSEKDLQKINRTWTESDQAKSY